jgi:hypothetical protein
MWRMVVKYKPARRLLVVRKTNGRLALAYQGETKMRTSKDEFDSNGQLITGFDYEYQAWVKDGRYIRCGHPQSMTCGCFGREFEGISVAEVKAARSLEQQPYVERDIPIAKTDSQEDATLADIYGNAQLGRAIERAIDSLDEEQI